MESDPPVGAAIVTADGQELGKVKEVEGRFFKVGVPLRRDYWLDSADVAEIDADGTVCLGFAKEQLEDYKYTSPSLV